MDIKEFVSTALVQVMEGVADAQAKASALGGIVNPTPYSRTNEAGHIGLTADGQMILTMSFDIAVTASSESSAEGGARLQVLSLKAGAGASGKWAEGTASRIQFVVPLLLPLDSISERANMEKNAEIERKVSRGPY